MKNKACKHKNDAETVAMRVSVITMIGNLILSAGKLAAGIFAHSSAMVSDAVHSASDVISTIIVMIGIKLSNKKADKEHPYGHERLECVASILLSVILALVGVGMGYNGVLSIINGNGQEIQVPDVPALITAIISIVVKEGMYRYTAFAAKCIQSTALMADAWHHRSDAFSSIGAFIGIAGARLGLPMLDPIASIIICIFILKAAWNIFMDAINKMVDHSCDDIKIEQIREAVLSVEGVLCIDSLKTRLFGARLYVDIEIGVNGQLTLVQAHKIAEAVHDEIEEKFADVKHCMVHENPYKEQEEA